MKEFERITHDTQVMGGKPTIRGMRVTVGAIVGLIGAGHTVEEVLADYPYLEREDLLQALRYVAVYGVGLGDEARDVVVADEVDHRGVSEVGQRA